MCDVLECMLLKITFPTYVSTNNSTPWKFEKNGPVFKASLSWCNYCAIQTIKNRWKWHCNRKCCLKNCKGYCFARYLYAIITSYLNEGVGARSVIVGQFLHRHSYAACISFNGTVLTLAIYWVLWEMASGLKGIVFWPHDERWSDKRP